MLYALAGLMGGFSRLPVRCWRSPSSGWGSSWEYPRGEVLQGVADLVTHGVQSGGAVVGR